MANKKAVVLDGARFREAQSGDTVTDGNGTQLGGGSVSLSSASIAFTDGDTARRVTVADAAVSSTSLILPVILRPTTTAENDPGYLYTVNVVSRGAGTFDVNVVCLDWSGGDCTERPPNETVTLIYTVG